MPEKIPSVMWKSFGPKRQDIPVETKEKKQISICNPFEGGGKTKFDHKLWRDKNCSP
jgi:hypothetical protein